MHAVEFIGRKNDVTYLCGRRSRSALVQRRDQNLMCRHRCPKVVSNELVDCFLLLNVLGCEPEYQSWRNRVRMERFLAKEIAKV